MERLDKATGKARKYVTIPTLTPSLAGRVSAHKQILLPAHQPFKGPYRQQLSKHA